jgi:hypothetical protein
MLHVLYFCANLLVVSPSLVLSLPRTSPVFISLHIHTNPHCCPSWVQLILRLFSLFSFLSLSLYRRCHDRRYTGFTLLHNPPKAQKHLFTFFFCASSFSRYTSLLRLFTLPVLLSHIHYSPPLHTCRTLPDSPILRPVHYPTFQIGRHCHILFFEHHRHV